MLFEVTKDLVPVVTKDLVPVGAWQAALIANVLMCIVLAVGMGMAVIMLVLGFTQICDCCCGEKKRDVVAEKDD